MCSFAIIISSFQWHPSFVSSDPWGTKKLSDLFSSWFSFSPAFLTRCMWPLRAASAPWQSLSTITPQWLMGWWQHCTTPHPSVTSPRFTACPPSMTNGRWNEQILPWSTNSGVVSMERFTLASGRNTAWQLLWKHWRWVAENYIFGHLFLLCWITWRYQCTLL